MCLVALLFNFAEKPGAGMGPIIVGSAGGNAQNFGGFLQSQPYKIAELHQFGFGLVLGGEFVERLVHAARAGFSAAPPDFFRRCSSSSRPWPRPPARL